MRINVIEFDLVGEAIADDRVLHDELKRVLLNDAYAHQVSRLAQERGWSDERMWKAVALVQSARVADVMAKLIRQEEEKPLRFETLKSAFNSDDRRG